MELKRQHPIKIIDYSSKSFWLLSIPLIRGLFYLQFDLWAWIQGAWFDIFVLLVILIYGFFQWYFYTFDFDDLFFYINKGFLFKSKIVLERKKITVIAVEKNFYLSPFRSGRVFIDTNSGTSHKSDFSLVVKNSEIRDFKIHYGLNNKDFPGKHSYYPSKLHLLYFSFLFSNTLSGVVFISTLVYQGGKLLGKELELIFYDTFNQVTQFFSSVIPEAAVIISLIIFCGWILSVIINLLRHWNFNVLRSGKNLIVNGGFLTKRTFYINAKKINYADIRQSLVTILFRLSSLNIHCSGYGKSKHSIAVILPITTNSQISNAMKMLLPSYIINKISINPTPSQIRRFAFMPFLAIILLPVISRYAIRYFTVWNDIIYFAALFAIIPFVWLLIVNIVCCFTSGIGEQDNYFTLKYCTSFQFHTILVHRDKIVKVKLSQNFFQQKSDNCNLIIFTTSERGKYHTIKYLPYKKTKEFLINAHIFSEQL